MLLEAMQRLVPKEIKSAPYTEGLKEVNWKLVAFYPFTPRQCEQKWNEILESVSSCMCANMCHRRNLFLQTPQ